MRRMSFALTEPAFLARAKTVTRRAGWRALRPGERIHAVDKCMGLRPGQTARTLGYIEVVDVRRERLDAITAADVLAEGVQGVRTPHEFVTMFCAAMGYEPSAEVTRIEFRHVDPPAPGPPPAQVGLFGGGR